MIVRKTVVAGLFLALAGFFFIGAGEASAQYRPAGGNNRFNQTEPSFDETGAISIGFGRGCLWKCFSQAGRRRSK